MKTVFFKMPVEAPKGKHDSGETLNRYILEGSNGSKQQKAEKKMETGMQCGPAVSWGAASATLGCFLCFRMGIESCPKLCPMKYLHTV